jgi:protein-S-isoprenylcysteine O-methyltransferase Ste14
VSRRALLPHRFGVPADCPAPAGGAYACAVTRRGAAAGSLTFVVAQPGLMCGLVPYWLTGGWESADSPLVLKLVGAALLAAGLGFLAHTVIRFAVEGLGTPSPVAPTEKLVVGGVYRYLRNPMYVAVIAVIFGQAAILGRPVLLVYAAIFWLVVASEPPVRRAVRRLPARGPRLVGAADALGRRPRQHPHGRGALHRQRGQVAGRHGHVEQRPARRNHLRAVEHPCGV